MAAQEDWQQRWEQDIQRLHPAVASRPFAEYARLSTAADGSLYKVEAQLDDLDVFAEQRNIPTDPTLIFVDNNLSAWKRDRDGRPLKRKDWDRLMKVAASGQIAGILIPALDRFTRRPSDLEALIDLAHFHGLILDGPRSGRINLNTAQGRQQARWMANQAAAESDNTSERCKATLARKMREGKPMGSGRIFGFEVGGQVQRPAEVEVIRRAARRLLAGHPLQVIAAQLNAEPEGLQPEGIDSDEYIDRTSDRVPTAKGRTWTGGNLGRLLAQHRFGGYVTHRQSVDEDRPTVKVQRIVGRIPGDPILDQETYEAVQSMLSSRRRGRRLTGEFLLTGLATCGRCEAAGRTHALNGLRETRLKADGARARRYTCLPQRGGCTLSILAEPVEAKVRAKVLELLADPDTTRLITAQQAARNQAREAAQRAVDGLDEQLADLEAKYAIGELRRLSYDRAKPILDMRMAKALANLADCQPGSPTDRSPLPELDAQAWDDLPYAEQRILVERLRLRIVIQPHPAGAPRNRLLLDRIEVSIRS